MRNLVIGTLAVFTLLFAGCSESGAAATTPETAATAIKAIFSKIGTAAATVKDEATAKTAGTTIGGLVETAKATLGKLPKDAIAKVMGMIGGEKGKLLETLGKLPANLQTHLKSAIEKLTALGK
ncbi:MAG: hypothetical protein KDC87_13740 [Planctomycetes bacterium]|nr:hypothetical protein [Planctomycetota bacterium]MCB9871730.1 hypothetical protein [Planctomycetota bacterium]MCB9888911.1 hypothetical protein [Planctomycetota bacterium]